MSLDLPQYNQILLGNNREIMKLYPPETFHLIFTDPPYNLGLDYGAEYKDKLPMDIYLQNTRKWLEEAWRTLKKGGAIAIVINDENVAYYFMILIELGFIFRNIIIWRYGFGNQTQDKFARCHAQILYFIKPGAEFTFNREAVKILSDRQVKYNDKRAVKGGKVMPDVWDFIPDFKDNLPDVLNIPRVDLRVSFSM